MEATQLAQAKALAPRIAAGYAARVGLDVPNLADELVSAAMLDVTRGGFDPTRGASFTTWLHQVMSCDALSMIRSNCARSRLTQRAGQMRLGRPASEPDEILRVGGVLTSKKVFRMRWAQLRGGRGAGRRGSPPMAYLLAGVMRRRNGWTWGELHTRLADDAELRRELGFCDRPSVMGLKRGLRRVMRRAATIKKFAAGM